MHRINKKQAVCTRGCILRCMLGRNSVHHRKRLWPEDTFSFQIGTVQTKRILARCQTSHPGISRNVCIFQLTRCCRKEIWPKCLKINSNHRAVMFSKNNRIRSRLHNHGFTHTHTHSLWHIYTNKNTGKASDVNRNKSQWSDSCKTSAKTEIWALTNNHESELKPPLHRLPVHLVGEVSKANKCLQILLLLQEIKKKDKNMSKPTKKAHLSHPSELNLTSFQVYRIKKPQFPVYLNLYFMGACCSVFCIDRLKIKLYIKTS